MRDNKLDGVIRTKKKEIILVKIESDWIITRKQQCPLRGETE